MKLYNANFSPNSLRVRAVANELGITLEVIDINLRSGENKTDEYLTMNPNGKVPVLVDGDLTIWESRAINNYLASLKPEHGLFPNDAKARAIVDQWTFWQAVHLGPAMQKVIFEKYLKAKFGLGGPDRAVVDVEMKNVNKLLAIMDIELEGKLWIAGNLSVADFSLASTFLLRKQANLSLDEFPNVGKWIEHLEERPAWQHAVGSIIA